MNEKKNKTANGNEKERTMNAMPNIPMAGLSESARFYAERITIKSHLRASKPKVTRHPAGTNRYGLAITEPDDVEGSTAYVWRMVAFIVSPNPKHHCMPCTADFDLPGRESGHQQALADELQLIVDEIIDAIPVTEWHGANRWCQVYGKVGTPRHNEVGAVIYR